MVVIDADGIYDPGQFNDRLVLGIKGTMSVVELKVLKMRMLQGMEEKARRGELIRVAPAGYVLDLDGRILRMNRAAMLLSPPAISTSAVPAPYAVEAST